MHQEQNFQILQKQIKARELSNRFVAFKLEQEQIKKIQIIDELSYICQTNLNEYKITMQIIDFLDCGIEKI